MTHGLIRQLAVLALLAACKRSDVPTGSAANLESFSAINAARGDIKVRVETDAKGVVHPVFFTEFEGTENPYNKRFAGDLTATPLGNDRYTVLLDGLELGGIDLQDHAAPIKICDKFLWLGVQRDFPCDALFIHEPRPDYPKAGWRPHNDMMIGMARNRLPSPDALADPAPGKTGLGLLGQDSGPVDLSGFASNQIEQFHTGTCLYNSTTAILEWFHNQAEGKTDRFSHIDVLGRLVTDEAGPEQSAITRANALNGVLPYDALPTDQYYTSNATFEQVYGQAVSAAQGAGLDGRRLSFHGPLRPTTLFFHGRNATPASRAEMEQVRDWLKQHQTPVQLFAMYSGIWHAIVALGWDESNDTMFVKDSLARTDVKGVWYGVEYYRTLMYGAIGVEGTGGAGTNPVVNPPPVVNNPPEASSSTVTPPVVNPPSSNPPVVTPPVVNPPSSNPPVVNPPVVNPPAVKSDKLELPAESLQALDADVPANAAQRLCYVGWVSFSGKPDQCMVWNSYDTARRSRGFVGIGGTRAQLGACTMQLFLQKFSNAAYSKIYQHCAARYWPYGS